MVTQGFFGDGLSVGLPIKCENCTERERERLYIYILLYIYIYTLHIYIYIYSVYIMYLYIYIYAIPQNVFQNLMIHHHVHPLFEFFTWKIAIHFWVDNSIFRHTQIGAR